MRSMRVRAFLAIRVPQLALSHVLLKTVPASIDSGSRERESSGAYHGYGARRFRTAARQPFGEYSGDYYYGDLYVTERQAPRGIRCCAEGIGAGENRWPRPPQDLSAAWRPGFVNGLPCGRRRVLRGLQY